MKGIKIATGCPIINHLLFTDDTIFFCKANLKNAQILLNILSTYESVSGQLINAQKSAVSFLLKTNQERRIQIKQVLGIEKDGGFGKYLRLPEQFGRKKRVLFSNIVDKIKHKSICWSTKFLSRAGKLIMLRTVIATMPSFAMSCFKLPLTLCAEIHYVLTRFWWDKTSNMRKVSWIVWKKMARPKKLGGLGFKDIFTFNDALLAKLSWRILKNPTCLLARLFLGKYCKEEPFLTIKPTKAASHGWRGILIGRNLLRKQLGWIVGSGTAIKVWSDPWLSSYELSRPFGPPPEEFQTLTVTDLMLEGSSDWDIHKLDLVLPFHKHQILQINQASAKPMTNWYGSKRPHANTQRNQATKPNLNSCFLMNQRTMQYPLTG